MKLLGGNGFGPESLVDGVAALVEQGRFRVVWGSADLALLETVRWLASTAERPVDAASRLASRTNDRDRCGESAATLLLSNG